jgi:hypothetical protein
MKLINTEENQMSKHDLKTDIALGISQVWVP